MYIYTIYKTTNLINGKYYIGFHGTEDPNDDYLGSGARITMAVKKYGQENFKKEVLFEFDNPEEAYAKEAELVQEEQVMDENCYNVVGGGRGSSGPFHPDVRRKISEAGTGRIQSAETIQRRVEKNTGMKRTQETRELMSKVRQSLNYTHDEATLKKMSEAKLGKPGVRLGKKYPHTYSTAVWWRIKNTQTGEVIKFRSLRKWCEKNNVIYGAMHRGFKEKGTYKHYEITKLADHD